MNNIDGHYFDKQTMYERSFTDITDDGTALLINLAKSLAYDDLDKKTIIDSEIWGKYGEVNN